jgi:hypothetical protein
MTKVISYPDYKKFQNILSESTFPDRDFIDPITSFFPSEDRVEDFNKEIFIKSLFNLRAVKIPYFITSSTVNESFSRFENYTKKDEVNNIALWILSSLKYCSVGNIKLGKELEINQENNPRDGRLDVVAIKEKAVLVIETKTDTRSLLAENRFTSQINSYTEECLKYTEMYLRSSNVLVLLAVGGEETDLYPTGHPDCITGNVGDISKIFYEKVISNNIKFISANALWSLVSYKHLTNKNVDIFNLLEKVFSNKEVVGLLSGGIVKKSDSGILLEKIEIESI